MGEEDYNSTFFHKLVCICSTDGTFTEHSVCNSAHIGQTLHFEAEISLLSCASNKSYSLSIKPNDLSDSVQISLEASCGCDCNDQPVGSHHKNLCAYYPSIMEY